MSDKLNIRVIRFNLTPILFFCFTLMVYLPSLAQTPTPLSRSSLKKLLNKQQFVEASETLSNIKKRKTLSADEKVYFYLMQSDYFLATNRIDSSGRYIQLAKKSIRPTMPDSLIALVDFELGMWHTKVNDYKNSYTYFKSSMYHFDKADNTEWYIKAVGNFGILSFLQGDTVGALHAFRKILHRSEKRNDRVNSAIVHQNLGRFFMNIGELDSSMYHYQRCIAINDTNRRDCVANSYMGLGDLAMQRNDVRLAITKYNKAFALYQKLKLKHELENLAFRMKNMYKESGNMTQALKYAEIYSDLKEEIYQDDRAKSIGITQAELMDLEKNSKILALRSGLELEKSKTWFFMLAGLLVLFILAFVFVKWKDQRKQSALIAETYSHKERINQMENEKLRHELELGKKALTAESLRLIEKNDQIQLLRNKMGELSDRLPDKYADELNTLGTTFRSLLRVEHSWEEFLLYFKEVHPDAHRVFDGFEPNLTLKEKRLLSLIYLELNTKEISKITGISPDSVKKARTRLRKKLSLDENDSFRLYITGLMEKLPTSSSESLGLDPTDIL